MGKTCWLSVQNISRFHICFAKMLCYLCILKYVLDMWESTFPIQRCPCSSMKKRISLTELQTFGNFAFEKGIVNTSYNLLVKFTDHPVWIHMLHCRG